MVITYSRPKKSRKTAKRVTGVILAALSLIFLTSCWDHAEITDMLFVAGIGLDTDGNGSYFATVEIINMDSADRETMDSEIAQGEGVTLYSALSDAMTVTGGVMFSNHCKVIVIGGSLAREGIDNVIDIVLRSTGLRKNIDILIAQDTEASAVLKLGSERTQIASFEIAKILSDNIKSANNTHESSVYKLHETLLSSFPATVAPLVSITSGDNGGFIRVDGTAVFFGGKMIGALDGGQSRFFRILTSNAENPVLTLFDELVAGDPFNLELTRLQVSLKPGMDRDGPFMSVSVNADACFKGAAVLKIDMDRDSGVKEVEELAARTLASEIARLISLAQNELVDIFDFSGVFERRMSKEWKNLRGDWISHFKEMEVTVEANISVSGSGLVGNYAPHGLDNQEGNALP